MTKEPFKTVGIRVLSCLCLIFFVTISSGCATRALMSSDRYEKPKPELKQFQSSGSISPPSQSDALQREHATSATNLLIPKNNFVI